MRETIREQFSQRFGGNGVFYASAGRINLIGEHTDYNGGFVFPGAIEGSIHFDTHARIVKTMTCRDALVNISREVTGILGRINLIGEHTDYNGGFVFPGAIDKVIMAEIKPNGTDKVRVYSVDIDEYAEFGLNEEDAPTQQWARYIFGVCREV